MKHKFLSAGLACLALGIAAPAAMADLIVTANYNFPSGPTTYNDTINVAQYNVPVGYTLESVSFVLNSTMTGSGTVNNPTGGPLTFYSDSRQNGVVKASLSDNTVLNQVLPTVHPVGVDTPVAGGTTYSFSGVNGSAAATALYNSSSATDALGHSISGSVLLADFTGGSTVPVTISGTSRSAFDIDTGLNTTSVDSVGGSLEVIFDLIPPVPDSGTWSAEALMFGLLVVGTGRSFWRKGQAAN